MKLTNLPFYFVLFFAMIGITLSIVFVHELSHWNDYHSIVSSDAIYLFQIKGDFSDFSSWSNSAFAKYAYDYDSSKSSEAKKIDSYTEWKAYAIGGIMLVIYMICQTIAVNEYFRVRE